MTTGAAPAGTDSGCSVGYLVDVVVVYDVIKAFVDVIEHVHHLHGGAVLADGGEAHDVAEVNGDLLVQFWLHDALLFQ